MATRVARLTGRVAVRIPNQAPTCLAFLAVSPQHFVVGFRTWSDANANPFDIGRLSGGETGCLSLFQVTEHANQIKLIQSLLTPSGILSLHASSNRIATGTVDGHVRTYDVNWQNDEQLCLAQEHSFFPSNIAITSIQYHPALLSNLVCTTNSGDVHLLKLPRSHLRPVSPSLANEDKYLPSHRPFTAWASAWTPLPGLGRSVYVDEGQGLYTVGDDGNIRNTSWTITQNFLDNENRESDSSPINVHNGMGITGITNLMVPGRIEGRDIVATTGQDGTVRIVDMFTNSGEHGGVISTLKLNELYGTRGVKVVGKPYIPDEGFEDELAQDQIDNEELIRKIEAGELTDSDDEEEGKVEDGVEVEVDVNGGESEAVDQKPYDADEYGESINDGPWIKSRTYTLLVGDLEAGPTLVEVECSSGTEDWSERNWSLRKLATFGEHESEAALAFDAYLDGDKVIGASASLGSDNDGNPSARIIAWEYERSNSQSIIHC